jgi:hypothetical protein
MDQQVGQQGGLAARTKYVLVPVHHHRDTPQHTELHQPSSPDRRMGGKQSPTHRIREVASSALQWRYRFLPVTFG